MLLATYLMCEAMARAAAILGLTWQASPGGFDVVRDGVGARIAGAFTFAWPQQSTDPQWLTAEASTTVGENEVMTAKLRIAVPLAGGGFVVQGTLAYPDFHEVSATEVDPAGTSEERAITLDMVLRVFRAARECAHQGGNPQIASSVMPPMQSPEAGNENSRALEIFSVFVLSRMYRWGLVELVDGSAGLSLLQRYAARALTEDVVSVLSEDGRSPHVSGKVLHEQSIACIGNWFGNRLFLRRADDVYLDSVLYDVDLSARRRLRGLMSDPPMKDPANQLLLLRQAMATHPALWESARVTAGAPEFAFALGLDLEPGQIPKQDLARLLAVSPTSCRAPINPLRCFRWGSGSPRRHACFSAVLVERPVAVVVADFEVDRVLSDCADAVGKN